MSAATSVAPTLPGAQYVGGSACTACHAKQQAAWHHSDHDLAMQVADEKSVLGNFANAKFAYAGTTSSFSRRDGKFFVNTDGPDGKSFETTARLTAAHGDVPMVFITASDDVGLERAVVEAGGVTLLRKPFSNDALLEAVRAALGRTRWGSS